MPMLAYEKLQGSEGRRVWYRSPRYDAVRLFPGRPPRLRLHQQSFQLQNISLGGFAAVSKDDRAQTPAVGEVIPLQIEQSGLVILSGTARVCRSEQTVFGSKVALNLLNDYVDFDALLNRNAQAQLTTRTLVYSKAAAAVSTEYRAFCTDVLTLLRSHKVILDRNRRTAVSELQHAFDVDGAFSASEAQLLPEWRSLWLTGNQFAREALTDREKREAIKAVTELVLTPELQKGDIWDRSYLKPMGYPGDFQIMNQVYDWERRGSTVFAMLMHRLGLEVAECIKTRMEVVLQQIAKTVFAGERDRPAHILSLGCGSAREVELFLTSACKGHAGAAEGHASAEFTLIDQEEDALRYVSEKTYPHLLRSGGHYGLQCLNMSFTDILRGTSGLDRLPPQDLIYSVGLLDYLTDRRATGLVQRLFKQLAPGGLLIIGNMNETRLSNLWPMEFLTDWTLEYRDEAQMLRWVEGLPVTACWTETETTGRVRLLFARKG
jgi:extracellular factor (EF) 3-hydroxypalmitic acid methyl ester biosynthesis protein